MPPKPKPLLSLDIPFPPRRVQENCAPSRSSREMDRSYSSTRRRSTWCEGVLCKYFREGYCRDGVNCIYSHDAADSNRKPQLCTFYREGLCKKGPACNLLHAEFPCKDFHNGTCGNYFCKYSHMPLNDFTRPIYDQMVKDDALAARVKIPEIPKRRVLLQTPVQSNVPEKNAPSAVDQAAYSKDIPSSSFTKTPQFTPMPTPQFTPLPNPSSNPVVLSGSRLRAILDEWTSSNQMSRDNSSITFPQQGFPPFPDLSQNNNASDLGTHSNPACQTVTCLSEAEIKSMAEKQIQMMDTIAQQEDGQRRPKFGFSDPAVSDDLGPFRSFFTGHVKKRESSRTRRSEKRARAFPKNDRRKRSKRNSKSRGRGRSEKGNDSRGKRRKAAKGLSSSG